MSHLEDISGWITEKLPVLLAEHKVPGAAIGVYADGEVFDFASGVLSHATGVEATTDSVFQIGSITKTWTATLLTQLANEGLLDLDATVSTALEGGTGAFEAVRRLGLADQPVAVLALAVADQAERARLADGLAMHLSAIHPRCAAALVGDVAYGLIPAVPDSAAVEGVNGIDGELRAARIATDFLDRVGERSGPVIGIGQVAFDAAGLPADRACADRALRVLRSRAGARAEGTGRRVARLADVHAESLLMELSDLAVAHGDRTTGPVARLSAYDLEHSTNLVETLRAWLDAFGDVTAASAAMFVHPNTFRYRLRRLTEVSAIDLTDPEQRFAAMLQLRAVYPADHKQRD